VRLPQTLRHQIRAELRHEPLGPTWLRIGPMTVRRFFLTCTK